MKTVTHMNSMNTTATFLLPKMFRRVIKYISTMIFRDLLCFAYTIAELN